MKKILTAIFCIAALVFIVGCDFLKKYDQAKVDEFALAFAQKYLFDETKTFNEAYAKCYQSVVTVEYPIPKPEEFSIVSCTISEWQGVKSYHYSISHTENNIKSFNDARRNPYGAEVHGDYVFRFTKTVHLKFVVEADNKGNLRVTKKPIWETASGKSIEKSIDYTKQQIRKRMGYYP